MIDLQASRDSHSAFCQITTRIRIEGIDEFKAKVYLVLVYKVNKRAHWLRLTWHPKQETTLLEP